jgi:hypothetical protein
MTILWDQHTVYILSRTDSTDKTGLAGWSLSQSFSTGDSHNLAAVSIRRTSIMAVAYTEEYGRADYFVAKLLDGHPAWNVTLATHFDQSVPGSVTSS